LIHTNYICYTMQLVFFTYTAMKKIYYLFLFLLISTSCLAQQGYRLYVEGEKQWAYRENELTDLVYDFVTKNFEAMTKSLIIADPSKEELLKEAYAKMLQSIPIKDKKEQISLFFGLRKKGKGRILFMTFFEGNLRGKRKDAFFQLLLSDNTKEGIFRCDTILISDEKHRISYKEPSVKLRTRYQKEVMQEYEARALEKNAKQELEKYINTRKRWRKMLLSE